MLSTAQQVRIWCGVGVGVLLTLGVFGMAGSLTTVGNTIVASNDNAFFAWFGFVTICLAAEAVLAGITIGRLYHPAAAKNAPQPQAPPNYWQPPAYAQPPPSYGQPPAYGQPPPSYGQPPADAQPPPSYGQPPPAYGQPPPQHQND